MKFIMYSSYEDIDKFIIPEDIFDDFIYIYEKIIDTGFKQKDIILDVNRIDYGETDSVKEWLEIYGANFNTLEFDNDFYINKLINVCEYFGVKRFFIDGKNIIREGGKINENI